MVTQTSFTFVADPDPERLRRALRHYFQRAFMLTRTGGTVILLCGLLVGALGEYLTAFAFVLLGAVLAFVVPIRIMNTTLAKLTAAKHGPTTHRIDEQGVFGSNDLLEALYRWPALTRVEEMPGLLMIVTVQSAYVTVGTAGLDPETSAALTEFVRERVGRA
ncbi:hypothetical protein [Actinoplanes sp. HUAS TT8]|uniref:hypothetical protein n=1 Tax=Actinoplanes sp. HUAS TT8 TaxID=3447453 RepID=UPI003F526B97